MSFQNTHSEYITNNVLLGPRNEVVAQIEIVFQIYSGLRKNGVNWKKQTVVIYMAQPLFSRIEFM